MSEQHTPGPWHLSHNGWYHVVRGRGGQYIADFGISDTAPNELAENARRIVAAVNAVEGIPTEALEGGIVRDIIEAFREILDLVDKGDLSDAQPDNPSYEVSLTLDESRRISARLRGEADS